MLQPILRLTLFLLFLGSLSFGQAPKTPNAAEIKQMLNKLNVLGSALYVAAHPDDENTRFIAYLANEKLYNTAYLSATRGDGGQNLIGPEIRELLGLIRTQELLAARRIDGGQQFFARANDFGYSKNPEETLNIWDREQVLEDFVRTFRKFKPDIIITRFPGDGRGRHGHHTASAILAKEAFELAADASAYPELAEEFGTWQPMRMFFNTHPYFFGKEKGDTTLLFKEDLGLYNPLLGKSYTEIAALSRSMHKSQGFGSTGSRGSLIEYFRLTAGEKPEEPEADMFAGIDTSWGRIKGGEEAAKHIQRAIFAYDMSNPASIVADLAKAYQALDTIENEHWKRIKRNDIKQIIKACLGLYLEIKANDYAFTPGDSIQLSIEAINRSTEEVELSAISIEKLGAFSLKQPLQHNSPFNADKNYVLPENMTLSQPYWLNSQSTLGMYSVREQRLIGTPENAPAIAAAVTIRTSGLELDYVLPVVYKRNDPVDGEVYRPLEITPPVFANISEKVYVFGSQVSKAVKVTVKSGKSNMAGILKLNVPKGWRYTPSAVDVNLPLKGQEQVYTFSLMPPAGQSEGELKAEILVDGEAYTNSLVRIEYDHIPVQTLFPPAAAKIVKIDLKRRGQNVGYIMGAGDEIPACLRQIGYSVREMKDEDITAENLKVLDAVIVGIRAYNTNERMTFHQPKLMDYVNNGGTMIVQYNTAHALKVKELGPYPLKLSRDRVTVEEANISILDRQHPVLNEPNKITRRDFDGWVQERGLYFPNVWDARYTALLSCHDPGETPKDGGLLAVPYGKGHYIYTGYSWFRELPAGVAGAYRLFTNMISWGNEEYLSKPEKPETKR